MHSTFKTKPGLETIQFTAQREDGNSTRFVIPMYRSSIPGQDPGHPFFVSVVITILMIGLAEFTQLQIRVLAIVIILDNVEGETIWGPSPPRAVFRPRRGGGRQTAGSERFC